jgi:hypothetical protein
MADPIPGQVFYGPDRLERSVWVVIDPRDFVTGGRVPGQLQVRLKDVAAEPIAARSGVYCFTNLNLPSANYTVQVRPSNSDRGRYFDAEKQFALAVVPVPAQPLKRNPVSVDLLPRPGYPFDGQATLARGRLLKDSDGSPVGGAQIFLILDTVDKGLRGLTDERGEFVVFFPLTLPEADPTADLKDFKFKLRFEIAGHAPHLTAEETVKEGTTISLREIKFPGT